MLCLADPCVRGLAPRGLRVEDVVDEDGLREWATVKLRGFADSEAGGTGPTGDVGARTRLCVATNWPTWALNQFPCSATTRVGTRWSVSWPRVPFRRRVAQNLLARWCEQAAAERLAPDQLHDDGGAPASVPAHRLHRRGLLAPPVPETGPAAGVDAQRLQPGVPVLRCRSSIVTAQQRSHPAFGATWAGCSRAPWDTVPAACASSRSPNPGAVVFADDAGAERAQSVPTNHRGPWLWRARAAEVRGERQGGVGVTARVAGRFRTRRMMPRSSSSGRRHARWRTTGTSCRRSQHGR